MPHHGDRPPPIPDEILQKLGATGLYPNGRLDDTDEGEIQYAVRADPSERVVRIVFGKPVAWLGLPKEHALELAALLTKHAETL